MSDDAVNERIKGYLKDPTLYLTTVVIGDKKFECRAWSDGDDSKTAEDISIQHIIAKRRLSVGAIDQVTTERDPKRR